MSARDHDDSTRPRTGRRLRILLLALAMLAPAALGWAGPATAASTPLPTPTSLRVSTFTDPAVLAERLGDVPAASVPTVLAAAGDAFLVRVSLFDGLSPAAYRSDQAVVLSATGPGTLSPTVATMPAGVSSQTFTVSYSAPSPEVRATATVGKGNKSLSATGDPFRVETHLRFLAGEDTSLRSGTAGSDGAGCAVVDRAHPVCGRILLPQGATGGVALSLGDCPETAPCRRGGLVTQLIADLDPSVYDRTHPATMVLVCDKSLCGSGGLRSVVPLWSQDATGDLTPVPSCAAKNVIDAGLEYCADYVSSSRDGAGDSLIHVLFFKDVRGSI